MVAMSGGVDSTVAAQLLIEQGYDVQGLTMRVWGQSSDVADTSARIACQQLGIIHHIVDLRDIFYQEVVRYFVQEYAIGRTPNPCVRCNRLIKFGKLLDHALTLGADYMATGHYVRVARGPDRYYLLYTGRDDNKDQSYFLYTLNQDQLAHTLFPLGKWLKSEVRAYAQSRNLAVAQRAESQDICFLPQGDYHALIRQYLPQSAQPGPICDTHGHVLGEHKGLAFYTIGQRSGLGIAAPKPLYVLALDVEQNSLIVGYAQELGHTTLIAENTHFISGQPPQDGECIQAKIRYRAKRVDAHIWPTGGNKARIAFGQPLRDITPGQSVVLYKADQVLGGGIIASLAQTHESNLERC